jgi:hypothetical protein
LPFSISTGPDGDLWFTEEGAGAIGRITTSGAISAFAVGSGSEPWAITPGPGNTVWFSYSGGIGSVSASGSVKRFKVAGTSTPPEAIVEGPDGDLWFTLSSSNEIGRMSPSGTLQTFKIPTAASDPFGITAGPDGSLWFTEYAADKIARITTSGTITEYPVPGGPDGIAAEGGELWFTEANANAIGRLRAPASSGSGPIPSGIAPVLAKSAVASLVSGTVLIQRPGSSRFVAPAGSASIPFGSTVDATHGDVRITTATARRGRRQAARFYQGRFALRQRRSGATLLELNAPLDCRTAGASAASVAKRQRSRSLGGNGHGSFTTTGRWASATVLGTVWETIDHCGSTVVRVRSGEVRVTNRITHASMIVRGGHSVTERRP